MDNNRSHKTGAITVPSNLFRIPTEQFLTWRKWWLTNLVCSRLHYCLSPNYLIFLIPVSWNPLSSLCHPYWSLGTTLAVAGVLQGCIIARHQPSSPQLAPTVICMLGLCPLSIFYCMSLARHTSLASSAVPSPRERLFNHWRVHQQPRSPNLTVWLQLVQNLFFLPSALPLCVCLQLAATITWQPAAGPTAQYVYNTGSSYYHCMSVYKPLDIEVLLRASKSLAPSVNSLKHWSRGTQLLILCT